MNWQDKIADVRKRWRNDSLFFDIKTSGSTGMPKVIQLEKRRMIASAEMSLEYFGLSKGDRVLLALPADRVGGMMLIVRSIIGELDLQAVEPKLNPFLKIDLEKKVKFCSLTPAQLTIILADPDSRKQLRLIDQILLGGSAVPELLLRDIKNEPGLFYHSYGMTETISHIAIRNLSEGHDFFEALKDISFEVNEEDQLMINAPAILEGPILTNDIVELVDDRKMIWRGRLDNVINSGGFKIVVEDVEAKIRTRFEGDFYLVGEADKILGERLVMISKTLPTDLDFLEKLMRPKEIYIRPHFKYTENGKLLRLTPQQLSEL